MSLVGSVAVQTLYCCSRKLSAIIGGGAAAAGDVEGTPGRGGGWTAALKLVRARVWAGVCRGQRAECGVDCELCECGG
jgi:hypothetical protein